MARVAPTTRPKNRKSRMMWFLGELVVFVGFVVFCRACGFLTSLWFLSALWFLPSLWFLGELVDLRSHVVVKVKPHKDLTTDSMLC